MTNGFTLVELLVAMALGLLVLAGTSSAVLTLFDTSRVSADRAELAERSRFLSALIAEDVGSSRSFTSQSNPAVVVGPCQNPELGQGVALRIVGQSQLSEYPCLPDTDLVSGAPLLVVETAKPCSPNCIDARWPGWVLLDPGCHLLFSLNQPELRLNTNNQLPAGCSLLTRMSYWSRKVYFVRNYTWVRGDGIGAFMVKTFKPESMSYGQAEMLVPGLISWHLQPVLGADFDAINVGVTVAGWVRDSASGARDAPPTLNLTFTAVSRNLLETQATDFNLLQGEDLLIGPLTQLEVTNEP